MIRVHLTDEQRQELHLRARREVGRVSERIHFVLLCDREYSPPQIAHLFGYCAATVRHWLRQYLAWGVEGLYDKPRPGRPPRLTAMAERVLEDRVSQSPAALGVWATVWTVGLLARQLACPVARHRVPVLGRLLHPETVRCHLHSLGWRWRKPKHESPSKEDAQGEAKRAAIREAIEEVTTWEGEEPPLLLAEDESTFSWLPVLRRMWTRRGEQPTVETPGQPKKVTCFGALNLITGTWLYYFAPKAWAIYFQEFLEQLVAAHPGRRIYLILDNATIHARAKNVIQWWESHPQVVPLWLPTYSPRLNPVERLWGEIKQRVAANHCYASIAALQGAVVEFFEHALSREKALQVVGKANPVTRKAA
jgi:putative transposase